jgi:succinylglutamic semialdehyde dehydrogenase
MKSYNPATGEVVWQGEAANAATVDAAITKARMAFPAWAKKPFAERLAKVEAFRAQLEANKTELTETISRETGKPLWDSATEVAAMIGKVAISLKAYEERTPTTHTEVGGIPATLTHRPHGVLAVFGPYNFPAHLPNGHIVPALLAGNVVVFKPSELTPQVAEKMLALWHKSGLPEDVLQVLQGERATGEALAGHAGIDGLLFTGSSATGTILHKQFAGQPQKMLALEMGGNNPLIVWDCKDVEAASYHIILSAFITSGQRCTCARRLIISRGKEGDALLEALIERTRKLRVGTCTDLPEPFMGPVIRNAEVEKLLATQAAYAAQGGKVLLEAKRLHDTLPFVSPGIIDVSAVKIRADEEVFAPLLQVIRVDSFDAALAEANHTRYGLASAIFTDDKSLYERALLEIRAGLVNWNRQTTGASSALPFGGIGISGNHRPAAYYAADYCAYPVAALESETLAIPAAQLPGMG